MIDLIKRTVIGLMFIGFIIYLGFLWQNNAVIVVPWFADFTVVAYVFLFIFCGYFATVLSFIPTPIPMPKRTMFVVAIALILWGHTYLANDPKNGIYVGDLVKVLWVIFLLLGVSGVLFTQEAQQKAEEAKTEIIEV
jgi:hypothetical protein